MKAKFFTAHELVQDRQDTDLRVRVRVRRCSK